MEPPQMFPIFSATVETNPGLNYLISFHEDSAIAQPQIVQGSVEASLRSRWITPCTVLPATDKGQFSVFYHPVAFRLARNEAFMRLLVENAIESLRKKSSIISPYSYDIILSSITGEENVTTSVKPRYQLTILKTASHDDNCQKFVELVVWLPEILSANAIIAEDSPTNFILLTEKPINYELRLEWPETMSDHEICFCEFIKKEQKFLVVATVNNDFVDGPELHPDILTDSTNIPSIDVSVTPSSELLCNELDSPDNFVQQRDETNDIDEAQIKSGEESNNFCLSKKSKKHFRVRFNSQNSCLEFHDNDPVSDLKLESKKNIPAKTKDGCSTKKYNYLLKEKGAKKNNKKSQKGKRTKR